MNGKNVALSLILSLVFSLLACAEGQQAENPFKIRQLASGLGVPWGLVFISPREILFTERVGNIKVLSLDSGEIRSIAGAPEVMDAGQGGLLDVAMPPAPLQSDQSSVQNRWLYFTYSKPIGEKSATALARARLVRDSLIDWQELFVSNLHSTSGVHFGSRIAFDGSGHIFFSHGDRGARENAQQLANHGGAVLRLNLDGSIPENNPFVGRADARPEIWSYGHRNPQGLAYDEANQRLWEIEHGPRGGDEINLLHPGHNYGWPVISYGKEYALPVMVGEGTHKEGMEQPVKVYVPSIAPSSLLLYSGKAFPQWRGNLFAGALAQTHLNRIEIDGDGKTVSEQRYLTELGERIRHIIEGPQGWLYLSTDSGKLLELSPLDSR